MGLLSSPGAPGGHFLNFGGTAHRPLDHLPCWSFTFSERSKQQSSEPLRERAAIIAMETRPLARLAFPFGQGRLLQEHGSQALEGMIIPRTRVGGCSGSRLGPWGHTFRGPAVWSWECYLNPFSSLSVLIVKFLIITLP